MNCILHQVNAIESDTKINKEIHFDQSIFVQLCDDKVHLIQKSSWTLKVFVILRFLILLESILNELWQELENHCKLIKCRSLWLHSFSLLISLWFFLIWVSISQLSLELSRIIKLSRLVIIWMTVFFVVYKVVLLGEVECKINTFLIFDFKLLLLLILKLRLFFIVVLKTKKSISFDLLFSAFVFDINMGLKFILSLECHVAFSFTWVIWTQEVGPSKVSFKALVWFVVNVFVLISTQMTS